jgi:hypothetical protein
MKRKDYLIISMVGLVLAIGLCAYWVYTSPDIKPLHTGLLQSRAPQSGALSESIINNRTYDATNGAEQVIAVWRGATTPQSNNLSQSQIANYIYDATNGAKQVILSSNSSDIAFINTTSLTDGDLLKYDDTGSEWINTEGELMIDDNNRLVLQQEDSAAAPTLQFGDGDSGIYEPADDSLGLTHSGVLRWTFAANSMEASGTSGARLYRADGAAGYPVFSFVGDSNTGMWLEGADELAFSTNGTLRMFFDSTGEAEFQRGIVPDHVTSDPCGSGYPTGSIFYNSSANTWCGCDGTNDVKLVDGSACF